MRFLFIAVSFFLINVVAANAQNVEIHFSGIRSANGQVQVKIYMDDKGFQDDKPVKMVRFTKGGLRNGAMTGEVSLEPGTYGFAMLDDENANGKMEYNMLGMPKEGFGFSDFYLTGLKKPHFEQFRFTVGKGQRVSVEMKLRYL